MIATEVLVAGAAAAVAAAGAVALVVRQRGVARREALERWCLMRGLRFEAKRPQGEQPYADAFALFRQGHSRRWGATISGRRGDRDFTAFEYRWTTGGGQHSSHHRIHGLLWERSDGGLPGFELTPEGPLSRLGALLGMQDIDFEESPEFSRAYRLKGQDEAAIRRLFAAGVRTHLAAAPGQRVAGGDRWLLWWRKGGLPAPDRLDEFLEAGDRVRRLFLP